jgi:3-hydroxymyristoyl/3-hydroxydecanoyl-(acyl carrier protein) dehydratase
VTPLLAARELAAPLAWRDGQAISAGQFIAEAQALAARLPAGRPLNLCRDRYHFALGLAAALLRGQSSLLPPDALPGTLRALGALGGPAYLMADDAAAGTLQVRRPVGLAPACEVPQIPAAQEAACLYTSGSTGAPQPHPKRWGLLALNVAAASTRLAELLGRPTVAGLNIVATVPAQHSYGFESTVLLALHGGAAFEAGRPFYAADIVQALARLPRPRALVTTPLHLRTLLRAGLPLPAVDLLLSATAPLSPQLARQAERACGGVLVEIYGCTEAGQVASRRTSGEAAWTTFGALRITRSSGPAGERWVVAGGHVEAPTPLADVLELLDAQHFRLLGRANDLIHVAGKRSSLAHLNFQLNRIVGVEDGAYWLPDATDEGVVRPIVFVVAPGLSAGALIAALREHLEPAFVPRRVVHVAALPRDATGKLGAEALRRFALQTLGTAPSLAAAPDRTASDAEAEAEFTIAADDPAFAGHFPGHPVLPGAALLALVMTAVEARPALRLRLGAAPCIDHAKFLAAVGPGARLRVALRAHRGGVAFTVWHGATAAARGQLAAGDAA